MQFELPEDWLVRTVAACQTDDEPTRKQAWDELARKLLPIITKIAFHEQGKLWFKNPSRSVAEDAAMEAFLSLYLHIDRITDATGLLKWFTRVIQNKLRDTARARAFNRHVSFTDEMEMLDAAIPASHPSDYDDLHEAIRSLDPTKRQLIWRAYWLGFRPGEIAKQDGRPVHQVKRDLWRARTRLGHAMQKGNAKPPM